MTVAFKYATALEWSWLQNITVTILQRSTVKQAPLAAVFIPELHVPIESKRTRGIEWTCTGEKNRGMQRPCQTLLVVSDELDCSLHTTTRPEVYRYNVCSRFTNFVGIPLQWKTLDSVFRPTESAMFSKSRTPTLMGRRWLTRIECLLKSEELVGETSTWTKSGSLFAFVTPYNQCQTAQNYRS